MDRSASPHGFGRRLIRAGAWVSRARFTAGSMVAVFDVDGMR
jgi:hypothetical protein